MCVVCVVVLLRVQDKNDEWFTTNHFFLFRIFSHMLQKTKKLTLPLSKKKEYYHIIYQ
jgi:hypothetical protein